MATKAATRKTFIQNDLIIKALNHIELERPPVWMMRQAGRYLPEYRAVRKEYSFLDLCKNPEKAAEVSIQPLRLVGVDAIIMFSDILIPLEPMGAPVSFDTGSPKFGDPIRSKEQVEKLIVPDLEKTCDFVFATIDEIKKQITSEITLSDADVQKFTEQAKLVPELDATELKTGDKLSVQEVPVFGFAGAPWTLASYLIEGGGSQHYAQIKEFMYQETEAMHQLLDKLAETVAQHLILKLDHGVDMVQLFDTWASQLSQEDYKIFALPYQQKVISRIREKHPQAKIALYINGVANIIDYMIQSGADVLSIDWRVDLGEIRSYLSGVNSTFAFDLSDEHTKTEATKEQKKLVVQGNFDPASLLGTKEAVLEKTKAMLAKAGREPGYIANLGHGILPSVPVENAKAFISTVKGELGAN